MSTNVLVQFASAASTFLSQWLSIWFLSLTFSCSYSLRFCFLLTLSISLSLSQGTCVHLESIKPAEGWSSEFSDASGYGPRPCLPSSDWASPRCPRPASQQHHSQHTPVHRDAGSREHTYWRPHEPASSLNTSESVREREKGGGGGRGVAACWCRLIPLEAHFLHLQHCKENLKALGSNLNPSRKLSHNSLTLKTLSSPQTKNDISSNLHTHSNLIFFSSIVPKHASHIRSTFTHSLATFLLGLVIYFFLWISLSCWVPSGL